MAADAADGIAEGSAILDFQTFNGVGIITGPSLRRVIEQAGIKTSPSAGAGFKQYLGEGAGQSFIQTVNPQNITVEYLALTIRRQGGAATFGYTAVHIPFYIRNGGFV